LSAKSSLEGLSSGASTQITALTAQVAALQKTVDTLTDENTLLKGTLATANDTVQKLKQRLRDIDKLVGEKFLQSLYKMMDDLGIGAASSAESVAAAASFSTETVEAAFKEIKQLVQNIAAKGKNDEKMKYVNETIKPKVQALIKTVGDYNDSTMNIDLSKVLQLTEADSWRTAFSDKESFYTKEYDSGGTSVTHLYL
jgi:peptidoglycan hydrolase CwlO-like protein